MARSIQPHKTTRRHQRRRSSKKKTATSTGAFPRKQSSTACALSLPGPARTPNFAARSVNFRANRCLTRMHQSSLPEKFASNAPNYWSAAVAKLFCWSRASKWRDEKKSPRWNLRTARACNLGNISADVTLQLTIRSGILNFRRGHGSKSHRGQTRNHGRSSRKSGSTYLKILSKSRLFWGVSAHQWHWLARASASSLLAALLVQPAAMFADTPDDHAASASVAPDPVMKTVQGELQRATTDLAKTDPAPYYISYTLYDQTQI